MVSNLRFIKQLELYRTNGLFIKNFQTLSRTC